METSKKQPSHLYSIVSITLVLFVLGLLGILFITIEMRYILRGLFEEVRYLYIDHFHFRG